MWTKGKVVVVVVVKGCGNYRGGSHGSTEDADGYGEVVVVVVVVTVG